MGMVLPKMGINWTTATAICSGPSIRTGMDIPELWPLQGASKNKLMISHLHKTDMVGANLQVELNCLQLQAGISWNVLSCDGSQVCDYIDHCCATHFVNSMMNMDSQFALMTNLGYSHNDNMISSSWIPSFLSRSPPRNS